MHGKHSFECQWEVNWTELSDKNYCIKKNKSKLKSFEFKLDLNMNWIEQVGEKNICDEQN